MTSSQMPPPPDDPGVITWMAERALEAVEDTFARYSIELPSLRIIAHGTIPHQCPFLAVVVSDIFIGSPGIPPSLPVRCNAPRSVVLEVILSRCIPTRGGARGQAPSPSDVFESADELLKDAWVLLNSAPIMASAAGHDEEIIAHIAAIPAEAGLSGSILTVTMMVT